MGGDAVDANNRGGIGEMKMEENEIIESLNRLDAEDIVELSRKCEEALGIPHDAISLATRKQVLMERKHAVRYFLVEECRYSTNRVGNAYGINHATVIHSVKYVKNMLSIGDSRTREYLNKLKNLKKEKV